MSDKPEDLEVQIAEGVQEAIELIRLAQDDKSVGVLLFVKAGNRCKTMRIRMLPTEGGNLCIDYLLSEGLIRPEVLGDWGITEQTTH
jgi:hypothetical protein